MNCSKCGEVCCCPMEPPPSAVLAESIAGMNLQDSHTDRRQESAFLAAPDVSHQQSSEADPGWRDEVASRLNRYRARRKAPPPRYPSLRLPFDRVEAAGRQYPNLEEPAAPVYEPLSNQALALDGMQQLPSSPDVTYQEPAPPVEALPQIRQSAAPPSAKVIEFPRFAWAPPPPPPDQLAEPVMDRPRILDVPEVETQLPALGGITIEPMQVEEPPNRLGIDTPVQCAPLGLRIVAAVTDALLIATAAALFGFIFWNVAEIRPPRLQLIGLSAGIFFALWAAYQYLLIVYSGRTPGLALAHLELTRFDGTPAKRSLRRWRILASFLSAVSLGMGYVWVFLDEESLCWHDRITRTYLGPRNPNVKKTL